MGRKRAEALLPGEEIIEGLVATLGDNALGQSCADALHQRPLTRKQSRSHTIKLFSPSHVCAELS